METKRREGATPKPRTAETKVAKSGPKTREEAIAQLARAVDPWIRSWKKATAEHDQAKAERSEAAYNAALDAANIKYEAWCKAHHQPL
jgi:hypothetical protein